ncbi:MAG: ABC transporter ATP-binding protein [Myxococcales bacterium]|nr:ABC transporter ATP-binding protein [Myxococcales bacterium]
MPLLDVRDLKTHFFTEDGVVRAVDGVSFQLEAGEVLGIVGESGSGKSVTSLSLMRLIPDPPGRIVGGSITLEHEGFKRDLTKASEAEMQDLRGDRIAMIFQDPMTCLNPYLTIARQLTEVLEIHKGLRGEKARERCIEMLRAVGIPDPSRRFDDYPHQLSGGMRQRVMIAMALLCEPAVLIADEPTTALDVTIQAQILELIDELRKKEGVGVILITHDLGVVARLADRVAVMYAGRIIEQGRAEAIFADPRHPYTVGLARSIPRLAPPDARADQPKRRTRLVPIVGMPPSLSKLPSGGPFRPRCPARLPICAEKYPERRVLDDGREVYCHETDPVKVKAEPLADASAAGAP